VRNSANKKGKKVKSVKNKTDAYQKCCDLSVTPVVAFDFDLYSTSASH
jgi:hypothetical protein